MKTQDISQKTVTDFTEEAVTEQAGEVFDPHERIVLSERDFAAFLEAIHSPANEPTPRLLADAVAYQARHARHVPHASFDAPAAEQAVLDAFHKVGFPAQLVTG